MKIIKTFSDQTKKSLIFEAVKCNLKSVTYALYI